MQQNAPPPHLAIEAPRLALQDASNKEAQLVYLEIRVPRAMHDAVVRHHANLISLSDMLRGAGMSNIVIAQHVDIVMASYREALVAHLASQESKPSVA